MTFRFACPRQQKNGRSRWATSYVTRPLVKSIRDSALLSWFLSLYCSDFFSLTTPSHPDNPPYSRELDLFLLRFGSVSVCFGAFGSVSACFGSISGPFRVRLGVLGRVGVESLRGGSVREKNITTLLFQQRFSLTPAAHCISTT